MSTTLKKKTKAQNEVAKIEQNTLIYVVLLFGVAFFIHTFLNVFLIKAPRYLIDEGLYTSITRSLLWDGKLAFRDQPINYPYLLYSIVLIPVYWLNRLCGGDVYRYVQVFNTLLITSSIFPVFFFARDFLKDETKALAAAVFVFLMPDMLMGGYEMTECLIWPLALWMVFFAFRFYSDHKLINGLLTALFAGLMFACKPGAVAMGAALLLVNLILAIRNRKDVLSALLSLALLAVVIAVTYIIFLSLYHERDSLLGLYSKQTSGWKQGDIWVVVEAFFLQAFLFVFACGVFFCLFPYTHLQKYDQSRHDFVVAVVIGILVISAGTAVFIVPYKWEGGLGHLPLHLRYCAMYIPLMYVFAAAIIPFGEKNKGFMIAMIVFLALSIFPGARAGFVPDRTVGIDSLTLNAFTVTRMLDGRVTGWIATVLVVVFSIIVLYYVPKSISSSGKQMKTLIGIGNVFFALFIVFNSVCAHVHAKIDVDPTITDDAAQVNRIIGSKRCLGITQRYYNDIYSFWLDSRLNVPMQQVTIDQMFVQMFGSNGKYSPFVPVEQYPNINNNETPDTDTFVLGMTIAEHLELSDSVHWVKQTESGHFTVVEIDPELRWVDSMIYGLDDNSLYPGVEGYLHIFDSDRNQDGVLQLQISASGNGSLVINGERIAVDNQRKTYEITQPYIDDIPIAAEGGTIQIYGYSTQ